MRNCNLDNSKVRAGVVILLLILFAFVIKFCNIDYQDNDDYVYTMITSGVFSGTPSPLTVYEGYFFSLIVSTLYKAFPGVVEWYALVIHLLYILAFVVIAWRILTAKLHTLSKLAALCAFTCIQVYLLLCPQFTILASELALASAVVLMGNTDKRKYIIAGLLFLLSTQIRMAATLMVFVPMCAILFLPIQLREKRYWLKAAFVSGITIFAFAINFTTDRLCYQGEDWDFYRAYNTPRGAIEQNNCKIQAAVLFEDSIKRLEYETLCNSQYIDGRILTIDEMNQCAEWLKKKDHLFFKMNIIPYFQGLMSHCLWIFIVWYAGLLFLAYRKKSRNDILVVATVTLLFFLELIYCMNTSFMKERLIIGFVLFMLPAASVLTVRLVDKHLTSIALTISFLFSANYLYRSSSWESEVNERLHVTQPINELMASVDAPKIINMGITMNAEAYHVSTTPSTSKAVAKGWLNNIPLQYDTYSGYESIVDRLPIIKNIGPNKNLETMQYILLNQFNIKTEVQVLKKNDIYEIVMLSKND